MRGIGTRVSAHDLSTLTEAAQITSRPRVHTTTTSSRNGKEVLIITSNELLPQLVIELN